MFGDDQFVTVAVDASPPFSRVALQIVRDMTTRLEAIAGVARVDSLETVPLIRPDGTGGILVNSALAAGVPRSKNELLILIGHLRGDRVAPGALMSASGNSLAVNVHFNEAIESDAGRIVHEIESVAREYGALMSGVPIFRVAVNERMERELIAFVPMVVAAVAIVLFALLGDLRMVAVALGVGAIGCVVTLGVMGLAGVALTLTTMILPCVLLALGCAYSLHPLVAARERQEGLPQVPAMQSVARPVALSGLTTALGFASMATVRLGMIQELALFGALGVLVLTAASLSMAPALVVLIGQPVRGVAVLDRLVRRVPRFVRRTVIVRRTTVFAMWAVILLAAAGGVGALRVSTDVVKWFDRGVDVREDYEHIRSTLSGITPLNAVVRAEGGESMLLPERLAAIDRFRSELEARRGVAKALAVTDPLREINDSFTGEDGLPESEALAEQYLLLLDGVEQIDTLIGPDRRVVNVVARVNDNESDSIVRIARWAEDWWAANGPPHTSLVASGFMLQVARSASEITNGLMKGLLLALFSVGAVLVAVLRSLRRGALALVPNVVPIAIVFGLMGWLGVSLDAATVVLGSLALGIAVDDTVHLMLGVEAERVRGHGVEDAIEKCVAGVVPAVTASSLAICVGFGILGFSEFRPVRNLGLLTAGLVALCLAADLLLLPALLGRNRTSAIRN